VLISWTCFAFIKVARVKKIMLWTSIILSVIFSNSWIAGRFVALWEVPGVSTQKIAIYDYGIVLSGMFEYNKDFDRLSARRGSDRLWQAIQLYNLGKIKKILLSGGSGYIFENGLHESTQLKKMLIAQNIPANDILVEEKSRNTHENAKETALYIKSNKLNKKTFLLITSAIHMRRAQACFLKEGVHCSSFTTDHYNVNAESFSPTSLIPSADAFIIWQKIVKEWVGSLMYRISGYI
jgi:uncharacterized SAM-binding protein YcdF (DUF218 family)